MYEYDEQVVLQSIFELAPCPVILVSREGRMLKCNNQATVLEQSLEASEFVGYGNTLTEIMAVPADMLTGIAAPISFEHSVESKESKRLFRISINPLTDSNANRLVFIEEVTDRKLLEERLLHLSDHDPLTGLPNRSCFFERLGQILSEARREWRTVFLLCIDIDGFSYVNETVGHALGDRLLKSVSGRIRSYLADSDVLGRVGEDEFAVILQSTSDPRQALSVAMNIRKSISQGFSLDNQDCYITACIGLSTFPEDGVDADSIMHNADMALHRAKKQGRNTTQQFTRALNAATIERVRLESSLRKALQRNDFVLFYQPIVDTVTGRITGCEALIRWMHPEMGIVSPISFIPIAEETGQIVEIGEWVVREACKQTALWHKTGYPIDVAVNMSAKSFRNNDILTVVQQACKSSGLDPQHLHFELTETALMDNPDAVAKILHELKDMGIKISLDDFGTGYSSLSNLRRFPIDIVKIDRSFVRHVTRNRDDAAIAEAIIGMGHSLKLTVVAEGVDTEEQLKFLKARGCDLLQGYLISTPVSGEQFTSLLAADYETLSSPINSLHLKQ